MQSRTTSRDAERRPKRTEILHLGLGNFHRAHQAVYTARARELVGGDWGIAGAASGSARVVDAMRAQDLLYTVAQLSPEGMELSVPAVHTDAFVAGDDPARLLAAVADPAVRVVTLTVTEAGYTIDPATGALDTSGDIALDLAGGLPRTVIGRLARGLQCRVHGGDPLTVLSCDNLASNGALTERLVRQFLAALPGGEGNETLAFLDAAVTFPNSMVDRIVPATTPALSRRVSEALGRTDDVPVPAEPFSMWVMEDRFAAGRPAWDAAGAIMSDQVERYETVKLRLLNGSHSLIAYLGGLDGRQTIPSAWDQTFIRDAVLALIRDDYLPTLHLPDGFDSDEYVASLTRRWANSALGDKVARVGSDGSTKLVQRVPEPALQILAAGRMPHQLALVLAAWICATSDVPGFDAGSTCAEMNEPARARMTSAARGARSPEEHARAVLRAGLFPAELAEHDAFAARVAELAGIVVRSGVRAAAADALAASQGATRAPVDVPLTQPARRQH